MSSERLHWDINQFEADVEKKISHRKMLGGLQTTKRFSEVRIADQFFIFGNSPNSKKDAQKTILMAYPTFEQPHIPIGNVLQLSLPNSDINKNKVHFPLIEIKSSPTSDSGIIDEFVFQYNAGSSKMYGICVHVQPSKAVKSAVSKPFYCSENTKKGQFCFCMISKIPIFNVHVTFLHYLVALSCGSLPFPKVKNASVVIETEISKESMFEGLEVNGFFGYYPQLNIPDEFCFIIADHFSKTLFSSPEKFSSSYIIHFPPISTPIQKLILFASLDTLFSVLTVSDIVELLTALILDAQVIIIGSSMQEVSMTVYGLYSLITPFNYCGVVMPILPNNEDYLNLLNSPTPYIYGMPNIAKLRKMSFLESTYIVNLDKRKKTASSFFPKYPNFKDVVKKLNDLINSDDKPVVAPPESPKRTRIKPSFSIESKKEPQTEINDDEANKNSNDSLKIRRRHTVNKNDMDGKNDNDDKSQSNSNQLLEFPSLEKKSFFPEILNDSNPYKFPLEFTKKLNHKVTLSMDLIDKILDVLHEPLDFIFSDTLNGYFVTNAQENITIFNQQLFLASVKQEDLAFYEFLLESQTFQDYVEFKLDEFTKSKSVDPSQRRGSSFGPKGRKRAATVKRVIKAID